MKKKIEIIAKYVLNILTGIVVVSIFFALYGLFQITILNKSYANYFGYSLFEVDSGSMSPTINVKDMVVVKKTKDIKEDDIITFESEGSFVTHRVVSIEKNKVITKGDYNNHEDKTIAKNTIIGKVVKVFPKFGVWKKIILSPIVLVAMFFTMILFSLGFSYEDKKKKKKNPEKEKPKKEKKKAKVKKKKDDDFDFGPYEDVFKDDKDEELDRIVNKLEESKKEDENKEKEKQEEIVSEEKEEFIDSTKLRKGKIVWDDENNQDGKRPEFVTVLLKKGEDVVEKKVTSEENWEFSFEDESLEYTIDQKGVPGYQKKVKDDIVTNTHNPKKINIDINIKWEDDDNKDNKRPKFVKVNLLKDEKIISSKEISEDNKWHYSFINLYKNENGKEIDYTIEEEKLDNYKTKVVGREIINTIDNNKNDNAANGTDR